MSNAPSPKNRGYANLPIPFGWFAVAMSDEIAAGDVKTMTYFGTEFVMWRGEDQELRAVNPYCPHLGAHLGVNSDVVGNDLRCPFHHWTFNGDGGVTGIPYYNKWYRFLLLWATADGLLPQMRKDPNWTNPLSLNAENQRNRDWLEANIREQVNGDENLIAKVTPKFPPYGKRMLRDGGFLKSLTRDNVELVTGPIQKITPDGLVDEHGVEHKADILVLATGYKAQCPLTPIEVVGTNGSIRDHWGEDDPRAHLGITAPDFPNLFMIYGPNTNLGHGGSALFHSECQIRYIMQALREMVENEVDAIDVKREPFEDYNKKLDAEFEGMVWMHPGVTSWYKNAKGRVVTNSPWALSVYHSLTAEFNPAEFDMIKAKVPQDA